MNGVAQRSQSTRQFDILVAGGGSAVLWAVPTAYPALPWLESAVVCRWLVVERWWSLMFGSHSGEWCCMTELDGGRGADRGIFAGVPLCDRCFRRIHSRGLQLLDPVTESRDDGRVAIPLACGLFGRFGCNHRALRFVELPQRSDIVALLDRQVNLKDTPHKHLRGLGLPA